MRCCICDQLITDKNKSSEHIIHNAIGGILESEEIYCKDCNAKYGSNEDINFTKIFAPIVDDFNMVMSRRTDGSSYTGKIIDSAGNIYNARIKNGKVISAFDKNGTYHRWNKDTDKVIYKDFNLDNEAFKLGLVKIAFNYAVSLNINVSKLNCIFNSENKQLNKNGIIIPFIPMNTFDSTMEIMGNVELRHILRLFNEGKLLFVYIELFSTFQYYILISDCWIGEDIYKDYYQSLIKNIIGNDEKRKNKLKEDLRISDYKDALIISQQYQININEVIENLKKYHGYDGEDISLIFDKITNIVYEKIRKESYVKSYIEEIDLQYHSIDFSILKDFDVNDKMEFYKQFQYYTIYDDDSIDVQRYKITILNKKRVMSYPELIRKSLQNIDIQPYTQYKFYNLMKLCNE